MKAILFDLDDTLFEELSFVRSGFDRIATTISMCNNIPKDKVLNRINYRFMRYGRGTVFNDVIDYFNVGFPDLQFLMDVYRNHSPNIRLFDGVEESLCKLRKHFKIAVVTDGRCDVQRNKVGALGLRDMVDTIVYCMDYDSPKPSSKPWEIAAKNVGVNIKEAVIIGDDPYCDMVSASMLGIQSYRILCGKYATIPSLHNAIPKMNFKSVNIITTCLLGKL